MFLHVTFLQLMSVPFKLSKNSLGLERSALIKTSFLYTAKVRKLLHHATILGFFAPKQYEPTKFKKTCFLQAQVLGSISAGASVLLTTADALKCRN